jgi:hopene-associated glycosyltransferase HpnB
MTLSPLALVAVASLAAWIYLALFHGRFWHADQKLGNGLPRRATWPAVAVVIPARNEATTIGRAVGSLLAQDYGGATALIVVDDASGDGTAQVAAEAAKAEAGEPLAGRVTVVAGRALEPGWTGKLWAVAQGIEAAAEILPGARYVLLTDADIEHDQANLTRLVAKAEAGGLDLVSLMVRLNCTGAWERLLIPAFVFFFQKLYPFPLVNDPARRIAAAAGGCMLVRSAALARIGGIQAIRGQVIDDCALARAIKRGGPIWLGLADKTGSVRAYAGLGGIWDMVTRTAFVQLGRSLAVLGLAVAGMALVYGAPPLCAVAGIWLGEVPAALAGTAAWAVMASCYMPTLRDYGLGVWRAALLPAAALFYCAMTLDSARRGISGRGAAWKGRNYT